MSSILMKETATCPNCKKESAFGAYRFIDAKSDPQMKDMILDDSLFGWKCVHCDYVCRVYYDTVVYNPDHNYMIMLESEAESRKLPLEKHHKDLKNRDRLRLVKTGIELKEKIRIFEKGLDDRAMEAYKVFLLGNSEVAEGHSAPDSFIFETIEDDQFQLYAYANGDRLGLFSVPTTVYYSMQADLEKNLGPDKDDEFKTVDMRWAFKVFQEL